MLKEARILIVDDFDMIRSIMKLELGRLGYRDVEEAEEGQHAIYLLEKRLAAGSPFTIVICDWNMPVVSGLEVLERIRADERFRELPFIMLTAESELPSVTRAMKAGASDYLVKPISSDALAKKLALILENHSQKTA